LIAHSFVHLLRIDAMQYYCQLYCGRVQYVCDSPTWYRLGTARYRLVPAWYRFGLNWSAVRCRVWPGHCAHQLPGLVVLLDSGLTVTPHHRLQSLHCSAILSSMQQWQRWQRTPCTVPTAGTHHGIPRHATASSALAHSQGLLRTSTGATENVLGRQAGRVSPFRLAQ
jgi:hypothetical protein